MKYAVCIVWHNSQPPFPPYTAPRRAHTTGCLQIERRQLRVGGFNPLPYAICGLDTYQVFYVRSLDYACSDFLE